MESHHRARHGDVLTGRLGRKTRESNPVGGVALARIVADSSRFHHGAVVGEGDLVQRLVAFQDGETLIFARGVHESEQCVALLQGVVECVLAGDGPRVERRGWWTIRRHEHLRNGSWPSHLGRHELDEPGAFRFDGEPRRGRSLVDLGREMSRQSLGRKQKDRRGARRRQQLRREVDPCARLDLSGHGLHFGQNVDLQDTDRFLPIAPFGQSQPASVLPESVTRRRPLSDAVGEVLVTDSLDRRRPEARHDIRGSQPA